MAARIAEAMRDVAYASSVEIAREKGAFPLLDVAQLPRRAALRLAPAGGDQGGDPRARHPQQPPAVDRADRHDLARLRRQRIERHRAGVQLVLPAQEADARRHDEGVPGRGPRLPAVQARPRHRRRRRAAAVRRRGRARSRRGLDRRRRPPLRVAVARVRQRARDERAGPHGDERRRAAVRRHRDQQDGERPRRLSVRRVQGPLLRGVEGGAEGHRHLPPEQRAGRRARGRRARRRRRPDPRTSTPPTPTGASGSTARCSRRSRACAGRGARSSPTAIPAGPTWSATRSATSPCSSATSTTGRRIRSRSGSTAPSSRAASARIAKTLSMDMRTADRAWLDMKLSALQKAGGDDGFEMAMPPDGRKVRVPSLVSGFARLIRYRCNELGAFAGEGSGRTPVVDALMGPKEPKAGPDGTLSLDRRRRQPRHRRRLRAVPEGAGDARRAAPAVLDVAVRRVPARARRPVQGAVARHARLRSGVDRHEAAQAPELRRAERRVHGAHAGVGQGADLPVDDRLPRAADDPPLRDARHPRPSAAIRSSTRASWRCPPPSRRRATR